jgi:hypothetical protein
VHGVAPSPATITGFAASRRWALRPPFEALKCPKAPIRFTAAEGAGGHCEMMNGSLANRTVLDWLDETLGAFASGL